MDKTTLLIIGGVLLVLHARRAAAARQQIEVVPFDGANWISNGWATLNNGFAAHAGRLPAGWYDY